MVTEITRNEYAVVTLDETTHLVTFLRTALPLPNVEAADAFFGSFAALLSHGERARLRLLLDLREGPARNDEAFEAVLRKHQSAVFQGFERVATLMKTAAGVLQMKRLSRGAPGAPVPFNDEKEALAYLLGP